jgi:hypothetical protein
MLIMARISGLLAAEIAGMKRKGWDLLYESLPPTFSDELAWLALAIFVLSLTEASSLESDPNPYHFSLFAIIFEVRM